MKSYFRRLSIAFIQVIADRIWEFNHCCDYCGKPIHFSPGTLGSCDDEYIHKRCADNYETYLNTGERK